MSLILNTLNVALKVSQLSGCSKFNSVRHIKRWVAPTLRELQHRKKKMGLEPENPRSGFIEWNYRAELFAFGSRLNESFDMAALQSALTNRSYIIREEMKQQAIGIETPALNLTDNSRLSEAGSRIVTDYVNAYLKYSLPRVPDEGIKSMGNYLLSEEILAHVSLHLGLKDLILTAEYPPSNESMAKSLLAVIGSLENSSGLERAYNFVRDFICTQLNQKDLTEIWEIRNPTDYLKEVLTSLKMASPEPRLIGEVGKNTVLAAYHVAIYVNKNQIGHGFGEDVAAAIDMASLDALRTFFGIRDNIKPFDFTIPADKLFTKQQKQERLVSAGK